MRILRVSIRKVLHPEEEQVVLKCVEMTRDFEDVLYFEAVGERVFAYTAEELYAVKNACMRLRHYTRIRNLFAVLSLSL